MLVQKGPGRRDLFISEYGRGNRRLNYSRKMLRAGFSSLPTQAERELHLYVVIAIHHPKPEHLETFLAFMRRVETVAGGSPGMLRFGSWREEGGKRLIGLSMWESKEAFEASLPQIMSLHEERSPDWSEHPDDVLLLTEP